MRGAEEHGVRGREGGDRGLEVIRTLASTLSAEREPLEGSLAAARSSRLCPGQGEDTGRQVRGVCNDSNRR